MNALTVVYDLKVNQSKNPIGIDTPPVFSWTVSSSLYAQLQSAYRVVVASTYEKAKQGQGDIWDSQYVGSSISHGIEYSGSRLISHTAYYWRVSVLNSTGECFHSEVSRFVTGILHQNEWTGDWIGMNASRHASKDRACVLLRTEFTLKRCIREAYLSVAGLGYFDLRINGSSPDESVLNCCNTQYNKTVLYRTFDITSMLKEGANAVGAELGNGFYNEQGGVWNWGSADWRDDPKLMLLMTVKYADGSVQTILSEKDTWKATDSGPITFNSIYYGEIYDARLETGDCSAVGYDDSSWSRCVKAEPPQGKLVCQIEDPIIRGESFSPKKIKKLSDGSFVIYCPEMIAGWARLTFRGLSAGDTVIIHYGEKLSSDGSVQRLGGTDGVNAHWWPERYNMTDTYVARGAGTETYEPKFSYKGYEYIQIYGYSGKLSCDDIILYRVRNSLEVTGFFECSDRLINDLHAMMVRTMKNNLQGKPTDTPVWEKNGWLGDLNVALETFTYNFDFSAFLPNFIAIMEDCYHQYRLLPQMVPTADWGVADHYVWNSVLVFSVYRLYKVYGMGYFAKKKYSLLREYCRGVINAMRSNGWIAPDNQLGDWVSPMNSQDARYNESPNEGSSIVATAYVYRMLNTMARIASLTGHGEDIKIYSDASENVYRAFNGKFYSQELGYYETGVWHSNGPERTPFRQTSQLVPLAFGLVPEENIQSVVDALLKDIADKDCHLDTGCVGSREILPVLSDLGYADTAYKILTSRTYPSWGFMIEKGSTSLWEMWETSARSLDHYFLGTYDQWLFEYLAGVTDIENGYESFTVKPYIPKELSYVTCRQNTVRGPLEASWKKNGDGRVTFNITVPYGSVARVYFPADTLSVVRQGSKQITESTSGVLGIGKEGGSVFARLGSGSYEFSCPFVFTINQ